MFLLLPPFWVQKLMICQSENLKQFSKLGNQFIISYYITYKHYITYGYNTINIYLKYYVQHHR
jgi:hypothetical protein